MVRKILGIFSLLVFLICLASCEESSCNHKYKQLDFGCKTLRVCELCLKQDYINVREHDYLGCVCVRCGAINSNSSKHEYFGGVCKNCKTKQGDWEIRYKKDVFGQTTDEPYIFCNYIKSDDWDLNRIINKCFTLTWEDERLLIKSFDAYGYGADYPTNYKYDIYDLGFGGEKYDITILDQAGNKHYTTGKFSKTYSAIIPDDCTLLDLLMQKQEIRIHTGEDLFTVNTGNFADVYKDFLTLSNDQSEEMESFCEKVTGYWGYINPYGGELMVMHFEDNTITEGFWRSDAIFNGTIKEIKNISDEAVELRVSYVKYNKYDGTYEDAETIYKLKTYDDYESSLISFRDNFEVYCTYMGATEEEGNVFFSACTTMKKLMSQLYPNESYSYEIDNGSGDYITFRVYDPSATTTSNLIGWYYVNKENGLIYNLLNELVEIY